MEDRKVVGRFADALQHSTSAADVQAVGLGIGQHFANASWNSGNGGTSVSVEGRQFAV